jgi:hypothetical protein
MPRGRKTSLLVGLTLDQRRVLESWQRSTSIRAGPARRGRIILLLADGVPISEISRMVGMRRRFIYKWAGRFLEHGIPGLEDKPGGGARRGPPSTHWLRDVR